MVTVTDSLDLTPSSKTSHRSTMSPLKISVPASRNASSTYRFLRNMSCRNFNTSSTLTTISASMMVHTTPISKTSAVEEMLSVHTSSSRMARRSLATVDVALLAFVALAGDPLPLPAPAATPPAQPLLLLLLSQSSTIRTARSSALKGAASAVAKRATSHSTALSTPDLVPTPTLLITWPLCFLMMVPAMPVVSPSTMSREMPQL
jgi:hypothetical protein